MQCCPATSGVKQLKETTRPSPSTSSSCLLKLSSWGEATKRNYKSFDSMAWDYNRLRHYDRAEATKRNYKHEEIDTITLALYRHYVRSN